LASIAIIGVVFMIATLVSMTAIVVVVAIIAIVATIRGQRFVGLTIVISIAIANLFRSNLLEHRSENGVPAGANDFTRRVGPDDWIVTWRRIGRRLT